MGASRQQEDSAPIVQTGKLSRPQGAAGLQGTPGPPAPRVASELVPNFGRPLPTCWCGSGLPGPGLGTCLRHLPAGRGLIVGLEISKQEALLSASQQGCGGWAGPCSQRLPWSPPTAAPPNRHSPLGLCLAGGFLSLPSVHLLTPRVTQGLGTALGTYLQRFPKTWMSTREDWALQTAACQVSSHGWTGLGPTQEPLAHRG